MDGSSPLEGSFDSDTGLSVVSHRNGRAEGEADGLTSSEEGEAYPMEVVEAPSASSSDDAKDSPSANVGASVPKDTDIVCSLTVQSVSDVAFSSGSNGRSKSRVKQQCGEGSGTVSMGSAMDGMKAFWGAIHEIPSAVPQPSQKGFIDNTDSVERGELERGLPVSSREESEEEVDDANGLWTENGEALANDQESKKRFRRYTIAY